MATNYPTKAALAKHDCAVVILTASAKKPDHVVYDFEWFDRVSQSNLFMKEMNDIANSEVEDDPGIYWLLASVTNTATMEVKEVRVIHAKDDEAKAFCTDWAEKVAADPSMLIYAPKEKADNVENVKVTPAKVTRTVKGRKPSAAATAAAGDTDAAPAKPAPTAPRGAAKKAASAAAAATVPDKAPTPSALKERIAAKKAETAKSPVNALFSLGDIVPSRNRTRAVQAARLNR